MDILDQAAYHAVMFYAIASVAAAWSWGQRRGIPDAVLGLAGVAVPAAAWLFSMNPSWTWAAGLVAACYAGLWRWASDREELDERALLDLDDEERAAARARLETAADDGAAMMSMARLLEKDGRWAEALYYYEAARGSSERVMSERDFEYTRERLERAARGEPPVAASTLRPADWAAFAVAVVLLFWSPLRGAAALAALSFARWLRGGILIE